MGALGNAACGAAPVPEHCEVDTAYVTCARCLKELSLTLDAFAYAMRDTYNAAVAARMERYSMVAVAKNDFKKALDAGAVRLLRSMLADAERTVERIDGYTSTRMYGSGTDTVCELARSASYFLGNFNLPAALQDAAKFDAVMRAAYADAQLPTEADDDAVRRFAGHLA